MGKRGSFDFSKFEKFSANIQGALDAKVIDQFVEDFLLEMGLRALAKIKRRTPVDTGHLRRNWQLGKVVKTADGYEIELINETEYASYSEFGHRTGKDLTKWVEGRFMMTISMKEIERELPQYLDKRLTKLLNDIIRGKFGR